MAHHFTIGVEEEFQIIDPATCELRSHVSQLVSAASPDIAEQVKHELHQSIVETGTRICENVSELRIEMHRTRGELVAAAERAGLQVAAAGTHPFSSWIDQVISPGERYQHIVEEMGQLARSLLIFGTLEFRMFDVSTKVEEAVAIAALTQAIIVKLHRLYQSNVSWRLYRRALIEENKWRAARYGIDGKLIDFGKEAEVPMRQLIPEL